MARRAVTAIGLLAAAAALALAVVGCSSESPPEVPPGAEGTPDPVLVLGRDVFAEQCSSCHAADGGGKRGPKLNEGKVVERYPDPADQALLVAGGRAGMPAFAGTLTAAEIDAVVAYTREVL